MSTNQQVNKKTTKLIRIDSERHKLLKIEAARRETSITALLDEILSEWFGADLHA